MKKKGNRVLLRNYHAVLRCTVSQKAHGAILIEAAMGVTLFAVVLLGFAHLYSLQFEKMKHLQLLTEIAMGPQERTLMFDSGVGQSGTFMKLDDNTTPSLRGFADTIGNFVRDKRASDPLVLYLRLVYIPIDSETGVPTQETVQDGDGVFQYVVGDQDGTSLEACLNSSHQAALTTFSDTQGGQMASYRHPGTNVQVPIGTKLYDVQLGNDRYTGYIDFLPVVYIRICSKPYNFLFPQVAVSMYELIPRRLVN